MQPGFTRTAAATAARPIIVAAFVLVALAFPQAQRGRLTATKVPTTIVTGTLKDTTEYTLVKPDPWNGTLFVDLDSGALNSDSSNWLYAHGFARAGTTRDQIGSLVDHAADNLAETLDVFTKRFGKPTRALISGSSLGGQVAAVTVFKYSDRFAGAVAQCAGLMGWAPYLNTKFDVAFALKALLAPEADLPLVHIPREDAAVTERWQAVIKAAQQTPQGRARIALAMGLGQAPFWASRDLPEPPDSDIAARQQAAYRSVLEFSREFTTVRRRLEEPAGGATSWNSGVNYTDIYRKNVNTLDRTTIEALYREAGLTVDADLTTLARAPRVAPEKAPLEFVRRLYPFDGKISIPVMTMSTTGDPNVWSSIESAYSDAVKRAGRGDLLRSTYVRSSGHCGFSEAERLVPYQILIERLDTGRWPDTSPAAMNARAAALNLGAARFRDYTPPAIARGALMP